MKTFHAILLLCAFAPAAGSQPSEAAKAAGERDFQLRLSQDSAVEAPRTAPVAEDPRDALASLRARLRGPSAAAHMGGIFGPQPNTLPAFEAARSAGVDVVEMDLQVSADGVPVVYHDQRLDAWTSCAGEVSAKTAAELKQCRFHGRDVAIPTFEEVLRWSAGRVVVDAEFKSLGSIAPSVELVHRYGAYSWVYFQTQEDPEKYALARSLDGRVPLLFAARDQRALDWALGLRDDYLLVIEVSAGMRSRKVIDAVHAAGKLVTEDAWHFAFPSYEIFAAACADAYQWNIDIAVTNRPQDCVRQRERRRASRPAGS